MILGNGNDRDVFAFELEDVRLLVVSGIDFADDGVDLTDDGVDLVDDGVDGGVEGVDFTDDDDLLRLCGVQGCQSPSSPSPSPSWLSVRYSNLLLFIVF